MNGPHRSQAGYSLAEMLTVVAIVGVLAMVSVPSFITFYNSNRVKVSIRQFSTDLRRARALAITRGHIVKVTYRVATGARQYDILEADRGMGVVPDDKWTPLTGTGSNPPRPSKFLDDVAYFPADGATTPQTFVDENRAADQKLDVLFYPDGHVKIPNNATSATITVKSDRKIPKSQYTIQISPSGRVVAN
jgi:prepilin-type N-terminal cleavage/methylation domain-containing protein